MKAAREPFSRFQATKWIAVSISPCKRRVPPLMWKDGHWYKVAVGSEDILLQEKNNSCYSIELK